MALNQKEIGQRVAKLRLEKGLTQEQFANVLNISVSLIGKIETGNRGLSIDLAAEFSEFFNVSTDYILFGKPNERNEFKKYLNTIIEQISIIEKNL